MVVEREAQEGGGDFFPAHPYMKRALIYTERGRLRGGGGQVQ